MTASWTLDTDIKRRLAPAIEVRIGPKITIGIFVDHCEIHPTIATLVLRRSPLTIRGNEVGILVLCPKLSIAPLELAWSAKKSGLTLDLSLEALFNRSNGNAGN